MATNLQATLTQANRLLASLDRGYGDNSRFNRDLERVMLQQLLHDDLEQVSLLGEVATRLH